MNRMRITCIILFCIHLITLQTIADDRIRFVDGNDHKCGISCEIKWIKQDGKSLRFQTDENGYIARKDIPCVKHEYLIINPLNDKYFLIEKEPCPIKKEIIVLGSISYYAKLERLAAAKANTGNLDEAAIIYSDLTSRYKNVNMLDKSKKAEKQLYFVVGKAFDVAKPVYYDPTQAKSVMSPELKMKVMSFQEKMGLKANGILNSNTLKSLGNFVW